MIEVNKRDYKRALQWGFVPQNRVVHNVLLAGYPKKQEESKRPDSLLSN